MRSRATVMLSPAVAAIDRRVGCAADHKTTAISTIRMGNRERAHIARYLNNLMCPLKKSGYEKEQSDGQRHADSCVGRAKSDDD